MHDAPDPGFATRTVHAGYDPFDERGAVVPPVHLASTHAMDHAGDPSHGYKYSRLANPTRDVLEDRLAVLEGRDPDAAGGATTFASGTTATASLCLSVLSPGDHVVVFDACYGGTKIVLDELLGGVGVETTYVDATETANVVDAVREETKLVWLETPTNPLLKLCDVPEITDALEDHPAHVVVDNTFASPYWQRPLELGADAVVYSTTKYLNGHSDSLGGAVVTDDDALHDAVRRTQAYTVGAPLSPFDCWLVVRGSKTLPARMDRHGANAQAVSEFLADHPAVRAVHYPGLESHQQHGLAREQMDGFGGVVSFELRADAAEARAFCESLSTFTLAVSLGGVESLVEHPATMSAGYVDAETRRATGITDSLIRAPIGLEDPEDLIADLDAALSNL